LLRSVFHLKTTILICFVVFLVSSCSKSSKPIVKEKHNPNSVDIYTPDVLREVELLYFKDQKNRRLSSLVNRASGLVCDTTKNSKMVRKELQSVEKMIGFYLYNEEDKINTQRLLEITKRYGFPTLTDSIHNVPSYVIFLHTPDEQAEEVRRVVLNEFKNGRMSGYERAKILWHLDGRSFDDFPQGGIGIRYYTDKEVFDYLTKTGEEKFYPPR
jgi:hypothetical protein